MLMFMRPTLLVTGTNTLILLSHSFLGTLAKCEKSNCYLHYVCLSVCPAIYMEHLSFLWLDLNGTWYCSTFWNPIKKIKFE